MEIWGSNDKYWQPPPVPCTRPTSNEDTGVTVTRQTDVVCPQEDHRQDNLEGLKLNLLKFPDASNNELGYHLSPKHPRTSSTPPSIQKVINLLLRYNSSGPQTEITTVQIKINIHKWDEGINSFFNIYQISDSSSITVGWEFIINLQETRYISRRKFYSIVS